MDILIGWPGLDLVCVILIAGWLSAGAVLAIGQGVTQLGLFGRVIYWDWLLWCLVLGPLNRIANLLPGPIARGANRFLDFTRRRWQSRGDEHLARAADFPPWFDFDAVAAGARTLTLNLLAGACCVAFVLIAFAIGGLPAYFFGFAWGVIALAASAYGAARLCGGGIEGGWSTFILWFVLFVGFIVGLLVRWLT